MEFLVWALLVVSVLCHLNTLYSYQDGKIYLHLENNDLISLDFSIFNDNNHDQQKVFDYESNQEITPIVSPPENSSLFLSNTTLMAFTGTKYDDCEYGKLTLYQLVDDEWKQKSIETESLNDECFYMDSNYLYSPNYNDIYIYGGRKSEDTFSSRLLALDVLGEGKVSNITTNTKPQAFYGASNLLAPDPDNQLVFGGESDQGWLNMYQLANWDFNSGWTSQVVEKGSESVESRRFPVLLPIFKNTMANYSQFLNEFSLSDILILGGELSSTTASKEVIQLGLQSNTWSYTVFDKELDMDEYLGFATVFDNLITIKNDNSKKRQSSYNLQIYSLPGLKEIQKVEPPKTKENTNSDSSSEVTKDAVVGTLVPIIGIGMIVLTGYVIMKKKKKDRMKQELERLNYQFTNDFDPKLETGYQGALLNDSNSTLDVQSMDSWMKKRQEYKTKSYLDPRNEISQDTLHDNNETPYHNDTNNNNNNNNNYDDDDDDDDDDIRIIRQPPSPSKTIHRLNRSMVRLKNSVSLSNINQVPPQDDESKIENTNLTLSKPKPPLSNSCLDTITQSHNDLDNLSNDDQSLLDDDIDVQVLVSSKRRSVLRVVNPDVENQSRKRVPSNEVEE